MRKTCKNHPKNEQKTHQKSSKNKPKKHTEKLTTQFQPKGAQTVAKNRPTRGERGDPGWNPPRKKKEYCKNQTYCEERVHAGRKHAEHSQGQHAPLGRDRPRGEFWEAFFTLRAYPPTHLHAAQFLRSAAYSRRNFLAAQFLFFLANRGGPRGGPRAPCKRPRAKGPKGPKGPSGPLGQGALRAPGPLRGPGGPLIRKKCYP